MSRSNQADHLPNPAGRWFEWNGERGVVRYYDKEAKQNVDVGADFTFILLDELSSVRGWSELAQAGIYSNEVRDTRQERLLVKTFKGGTIAEGLYRDIKDRVNNVGGSFVASCYIAFKADGELHIGNLRFKGAALGAWMEFRKQHRQELYALAVRICGVTEGKKGRIIYKMPQFKMQDLSDETNAQATELDRQLQTYLTAYFARTTKDRIDHADEHEPEPEDVVPQNELTADDIPF